MTAQRQRPSKLKGSDCYTLSMKFRWFVAYEIKRNERLAQLGALSICELDLAFIYKRAVFRAPVYDFQDMTS